MRIYRRRVYRNTVYQGDRWSISRCDDLFQADDAIECRTVVSRPRNEKHCRRSENNGQSDVRPSCELGLGERSNCREYPENKTGSFFQNLRYYLGSIDWRRAEGRLKKLASGVKLLLLHPQVASRDCSHCSRWLYDEETGEVTKRGGQPVERPGGSHPPCRYRGVGCPKGTPENSKALSQKNMAAYVHYKECQATGMFPDDPIVKRNAGVIRIVEDSIADQRREMAIMRGYLHGALGGAAR